MHFIDFNIEGMTPCAALSCTLALHRAGGRGAALEVMRVFFSQSLSGSRGYNRKGQRCIAYVNNIYTYIYIYIYVYVYIYVYIYIYVYVYVYIHTAYLP